MNEFLLGGECTANHGDCLEIRTIARTPRADYPADHMVWLDEPVDTQVGDRVAVIGRVAEDPNDPRGIRLQAENVADYEEKLDMNFCEVSGEMAQPFQYFPSAEGKRAFGNILLVVDGDFYMRGAVLTAAAATFISRSPTIKSGCELQMAGRIQTRQFEQNGEERESLEIVVDTDKLKVLRKAEDTRKLFDKYRKQTADAI